MASKDTFEDEGSVSSHSVDSDDDSHSTNAEDLKSLATETVETETDTKSEELLTMDETKTLIRVKRLVIILLALAALSAAVLTYHFAMAAETESFQSKFDSDAHEIEVMVVARWSAAQIGLENLAMSVISAAVAAEANLPSFQLPFFQTHGQEIIELSSGALVVGWCPMVPTESGMTLPIRQMAPPEFATIGYDLMADPVTRELFLDMLVAKEPVVSGLVPVEFLDLLPGELHTLMMQPIFNDTSKDKIVVGATFSDLEWDSMFQDVLAANSGNMALIVKNTCNDVQLHYEIDGADSTLVETGVALEDSYSNTMENTLWLQMGDSSSNFTCQYSLIMFPSQDFEDAQTPMMPLAYAILVVFVVGGFLAIFIWYDRFVEARQEQVLSRAARSNAIVASLFPSNVRDRILKEAEDQVHAQGLKRKQSGIGAKAQLKDFLTDGMGTDSGDKEASDSKPIADLFPHTTVLFGDVAGFTAWSSIREPSQVFILLETIYNAFDNIARRRRVFKVETIGDCYVAVSGLPEPRKDHAITMVRFARDLITTMNTLTRQLEVVLGPDTGDLAMRIGLHSGPVTAGVLRGQNCRFQLFGDTVNTAARMESNGVRDAVHISEETANLVREAGKEHWLVQREDKIVAKGKGEMTTYFIKSKRIGTTAGSVTTGGSSDTGSKAGSSDVSTGGHVLPRRIKRLVTFNAELLGRLLKNVVARRTAEQLVQKRPILAVPSPPLLTEKSSVFSANGKMVLDEVQDIITLPKFNAKAVLKQQDSKDLELASAVTKQLKEYVTALATMYKKEVPFHNFEHASHVTMSVSKLLSRIVSPDSVISSNDIDTNHDEMVKKLHEHTYGITSDPMTQFAAVVAALIHDVDHTGVPNSQLVKEGDKLAQLYGNKSVAEQNSVDLAWDLLMEEGFKDLRDTIYTTDNERNHFRQLLVNLVMATDICDKELGAKRKARWAKAFAGTSEDKALESHSDAVNRKATIVLEHLIQASDVAHTMQHWQIYRKWNEKFFEENMKAYSEGRAEKDPSSYWHEGELGFFDYYIIPLAKKLKECGVFGVSSDEYLIYAEKNREEWAARGQEIVAEMSAKYLPSLKEEDDELSFCDDYAAPSEGSSSFDETSALVMDQQTIYNVSESWEILRRLPNYEEEAGTILFTALFVKCPAAKVLFGFPINMDPNSDTIKKSKRFVMHATYMIEMLTKALELLGPDSEMLAKILADLGKKHVRLGVKEAFFPSMGEALMETLGQMLGDKLTDDMKVSWAIVYHALSSEMITAMNNDKAVLLSWNKLKMMPNYQEVAGVILFQKLFEDCPEAKILFGFPADMDVFSEAMLTSRRFKGHAAYFIEMLDKALDMVEAKQIGENMKRLGAMHVTFGVQESYFPIMGEALFHTLKTTLRNAWNDNTEAAWRDVYGKLSSQMVSAMQESAERKD